MPRDGGVAGHAIADVFEGQDSGHEGFGVGLPSFRISICKNELFIGDHLKIDPVVFHDLPVNAEGGVADAAGPDIQSAGRNPVHLGHEPMQKVFGPGPAGLDQITRGVQVAGQDLGSLGIF